LAIAYLSGKHLSKTQMLGAYSEDDVAALRAWADEPGIITNEWPSDVLNKADISEASSGINDSLGTDPVVTELVTEIKPRYHISGTKGLFYAREPYSNAEALHVTRFLGLAPVGNKDKLKFIHAISPTPASAMSAAEICMKPPNTTSSPYSLPDNGTSHVKETAKRPGDRNSDAQNWRYDVSQKRQRHGDGEKLCFKFISSGSCPRAEKCSFKHDMDAREQCRRGVCIDFLSKGKCERGPDCNFKHSFVDKDAHEGNRSKKITRSKDCWFCLSSPSVESHLLLSVGENCYCVLAKGPLVDDHALIIPIEHFPNTLVLLGDAVSELERFKNALKMYFKSRGKEVVFFEWVFKHSSHANLQAIPIPSSKAAILERLFLTAAERLRFKFVPIKPRNDISEGRKILNSQFDRKLSLFYVELPEGTILYHPVKDEENFPVQFGREVLAGLLNIADKADWRNCKLSMEEETKMTEGFKKRFEEFDPTM
ncbi:hypothetical protein GIB67_041510, partial [Kingdonia uniflora]